MTKRKDPKDKVKVGRPTNYTPELGKKIARAIATSTDSLQEICDAHEDFPNSKTTVHEWKYDHPEFAAWYMLAKGEQADLMMEQADEIARDGSNDWMEKHYKDQEAWVINGEAVARSRLRVDTIKWKACKLYPKYYGDRTTTESTVIVKHEDQLKELE